MSISSLCFLLYGREIFRLHRETVKLEQAQPVGLDSMPLTPLSLSTHMRALSSLFLKGWKGSLPVAAWKKVAPTLHRSTLAGKAFLA